MNLYLWSAISASVSPLKSLFALSTIEVIFDFVFPANFPITISSSSSILIACHISEEFDF